MAQTPVSISALAGSTSSTKRRKSVCCSASPPSSPSSPWSLSGPNSKPHPLFNLSTATVMYWLRWGHGPFPTRWLTVAGPSWCRLVRLRHPPQALPVRGCPRGGSVDSTHGIPGWHQPVCEQVWYQRARRRACAHDSDSFAVASARIHLAFHVRRIRARATESPAPRCRLYPGRSLTKRR